MTLSQKQDKTNNELFSLLTKITDIEQQFQKKGKILLFFLQILKALLTIKSPIPFLKAFAR
jgi:hypothetical protein